MTPLPSPRIWRSPPLALQIAGLLLAALVIAQLTTLLLVFFLPPEPPAKYGLRDIAAALRESAAAGRGLRRAIQADPPQVNGRGWLVSDTSRADLATMLGVSADDIRLSFYTPLPFAGTIGGPPPLSPPPGFAPTAFEAPRRLMASDGPAYRDAAFRTWQPQTSSLDGNEAQSQPRLIRSPYLILAQAGPGPGMPGGPPIGLPGGGFPGGGFPGSGFPRGGFPGAAMPHGGFPGMQPSIPPTSTLPGSRPTTEMPNQFPTTDVSPQSTRPSVAVPSYNEARPQANAAPQTSTGPLDTATRPGTLDARPTGPLPPATGPRFGAPAPLANIIPIQPADTASPLPDENRRRRPVAEDSPASSTAPTPQETPSIARQATPPATTIMPQPASPATAPEIASVATDIAPTVTPVPRTGLQGAIDKARGLLGLSPSPYVEGDFVAALHLPDGRWVVVQPSHGGILSPWQKRVALWFLISFAIVAPVGWLFARRLSQPLARFADAASQLGRDPSVVIAALDGPAEIGRAAHAFNLMQQRLRSFVDDRTAMVGAISHDLRTPLTRMRFRIEDAPDDIREGMRHEVDEMEEMITSVLAFIRDASTPGVRERLDLRDLLEDVSEDAAVVGAAVPIAAGVPATVEVDVLGMRRVLVNLVENALKYGQHARMELSVSGDEAVATVIDDGPGLPDEELEQVFQPFYRTAAARASTAPGTGLGLAVCRSIARAHGGDVRLYRMPQGFCAEVRVPLAYEAARARAA